MSVTLSTSGPVVSSCLHVPVSQDVLAHASGKADLPGSEAVPRGTCAAGLCHAASLAQHPCNATRYCSAALASQGSAEFNLANGNRRLDSPESTWSQGAPGCGSCGAELAMGTHGNDQQSLCC